MNYKEHHNNHDFFRPEHARQFLRNHKTGIDNLGRQYLGSLIAQYDNPKVLDVAAGTCVNWECWAMMGVKCQYTGFDLTKQFLDIAREKYGQSIQLVQGYAQELDQEFSEESFDIVVVRHLLEHIPGGQYEEIITKALSRAKSEVMIVFFLHPHNRSEDTIEERSSHIPDHPEVTHFWNEYSHSKLTHFLSQLNVRVKVEGPILTPGAAHTDLIYRLIK